MGLNEFLLPVDLFTTYVTRMGVTPTVKSSRDLTTKNLKSTASLCSVRHFKHRHSGTLGNRKLRRNPAAIVALRRRANPSCCRVVLKGL